MAIILAGVAFLCGFMVAKIGNWLGIPVWVTIPVAVAPWIVFIVIAARRKQP
jgi:hypothetical protein